MRVRLSWQVQSSRCQRSTLSEICRSSTFLISSRKMMPQEEVNRNCKKMRLNPRSTPTDRWLSRNNWRSLEHWGFVRRSSFRKSMRTPFSEGCDHETQPTARSSPQPTKLNRVAGSSVNTPIKSRLGGMCARLAPLSAIDRAKKPGIAAHLLTL